MKKITLLMIALIACAWTGNAKKTKVVPVLNYEIKAAGNSQQGSYLVEVTAYADSKNDATIDLAKQCAVHGVLFKGFAGSTDGAKAQKPILEAHQEQQNADFFKAFFESDYLQYASAADPSVRVMRIGKRYAVTATFLVSKDRLRSAMQQAGFVRKLGF